MLNILGYRLGNNNQTDQGNETEALEREGLKRERSFAGFLSLNSRGGSAKPRWAGRWARSASFCMLKSLNRRVHGRARAAKPTSCVYILFARLIYDNSQPPNSRLGLR
jgi:hypothetical protein